jgi:gamma-glutamyltranspeptidase/glutathione hydrolase
VDGAVSADTPEATIAGLEVLALGGNAVDAAVAVSLVLGVTEPSESGLGGSVVMLWVPSGGAGVVIVGGGGAAAGGTPRPDALRVLHHAWQRYGSGNVTWEDLVRPAIGAAADGHPLGRFSHRTRVQEYDRIIADTAAARLLLAPDRSLPAEGARVTNPDLAQVLERIAAEGPESFYGGPVGQRLASSIAGRGLRLTPAELAATPTARESRALRGTYRGATVWSCTDPHGGRLLLESLRFLELAPRAWLESEGWSRSAWLVEALAFAWEGGALHPVEHLVRLAPMPAPNGASDAAALAAGGDPDPHTTRPGAVEVRRLRALPATSDAPPARRPFQEDPGATTHFSIVDHTGNAVAVTQTLGGSFGSGLVDGLGFFYRQPEMGDELLVPTVVTDSVGRVQLVLGSPGGERAIAALVQVMVRVLDLGETLDEAVGASRLYASPGDAGGRGRLFFEGVAWEDTLSVRNAAYAAWGDRVDLRARTRGFEIGEQQSAPTSEGLNPWFGAVNAIHWTGEGWAAVGDERRNAIGGVLVRGAPELQRTDWRATARQPAGEG